VNRCAVLRRGAAVNVLEQSSAGRLFDTARRAAILGSDRCSSSSLDEYHPNALYDTAPVYKR
jgi:hypothetical protein